jgi:hypothetical protein
MITPVRLSSFMESPSEMNDKTKNNSKSSGGDDDYINTDDDDDDDDDEGSYSLEENQQKKRPSRYRVSNGNSSTRSRDDNSKELLHSVSRRQYLRLLHSVSRWDANYTTQPYIDCVYRWDADYASKKNINDNEHQHEHQHQGLLFDPETHQRRYSCNKRSSIDCNDNNVIDCPPITPVRRRELVENNIELL